MIEKLAWMQINKEGVKVLKEFFPLDGIFFVYFDYEQMILSREGMKMVLKKGLHIDDYQEQEGVYETLV